MRDTAPQRSAFDTVDHQILLHRPHRFGYMECARKWFRSYLSDRYKAVKINGGVSSSGELHYCVPQGTVLGPIFCLLYPSPLTWVQKISVVSVKAGKR